MLSLSVGRKLVLLCWLPQQPPPPPRALDTSARELGKSVQRMLLTPMKRMMEYAKPQCTFVTRSLRGLPADALATKRPQRVVYVGHHRFRLQNLSVVCCSFAAMRTIRAPRPIPLSMFTHTIETVKADTEVKDERSAMQQELHVGALDRALHLHCYSNCRRGSCNAVLDTSHVHVTSERCGASEACEAVWAPNAKPHATCVGARIETVWSQVPVG